MEEEHNYTSLSALLAAPKGNLEHKAGDAFVLHVFWLTPSPAAARELLSGLERCATATHRDTPCVPTYFFRIASNDAELCPPPPRTVGDHPHLTDARRKLQMGVPPPAVRAHLTKLGLDPALLDLDPAAELPEALRTQPVAVECTELYLDERAFMEHAGSRDYLDGYGVVMRPALQHRPPRTVRLGTPPANVVERILEPILHEIVEPVVGGCTVWRRPPPPPPPRPPAQGGQTPYSSRAILLSVDFASADCAAVAAALPASLRERCTTCLAFAHPLRTGTTRVLCVLSTFLPETLAGLAALRPVRGEAHMTGESAEAVEAVRTALAASGLGAIPVNATDSVGYVLHDRAADLVEKCRQSSPPH